jgi:hypothetical protein
LVVPQIVLDEFERNKARMIAETQRSLQSRFRLVREAVNRFGEDTYNAETFKALNEVDHKTVIKGEAVNDAIDRISKLLRAAAVLPATDIIKQRVTDRAVANRAPYHRDRNSVGNAIVIETYAELVSSKSRRKHLTFSIVTHNTRDFSEANGDCRKPHADLVGIFDEPKSTSWVSMVDLIKDIDPEVLADHDFEFNFSQQSRSLSDILEAEHLFFRPVWYNRYYTPLT